MDPYGSINTWHIPWWSGPFRILATAHCMKNSSRCFKFKGAIFLCSISVPPRIPSPNIPILERLDADDICINAFKYI